MLKQPLRGCLNFSDEENAYTPKPLKLSANGIISERMETLVNQMLADIERDIVERRETDRGMWFSMWILLSFVTFGAAWFLMIYYLIKRRNEHFARQEKLEQLVLARFRQLSNKTQSATSNSKIGEGDNNDFVTPRNALAWATSTVLILPGFYVFRFLMEGLRKHEEHEAVFFREVVSHAKSLELSMNLNGMAATSKSSTLGRYFALSLGTVGFAGFYWLYLIFNDYNRHFKRQWIFEDELLKTLKSTETKTNASS